jgi:integrase
MRKNIPFRIFKRKDKPYYYVRYKGEDGTLGGTLSTKEAEKEAAFKTAMDWFLRGIPAKNGNRVRVEIREALLSGEVTAGDAEYILKEFKKRGLVESYTLKKEEVGEKYGEFVLEFWDWERSKYIREKLHKAGSVHKNYTKVMYKDAEKYFYKYWRGRAMNEITRKEFTEYIGKLDGEERFRKLSAARKNRIIGSGTIPVRWAVKREIIEKDFTLDFERYKGEGREREVITPEMAAGLFSEEWGDERARLANIVSFVTGLRSGEVRGLQCRDIGENCLYINHAWSRTDGLKLPKNNRKRIVEMPFSGITEDLVRLAERNPHGVRPDRFVFWQEKEADEPVEGAVFLNGLRMMLEKIGFTEEEARKYEFHSWRHTYTTFMSERIGMKLLQTQTGHRTAAMVAHYANHILEADKAKIRAAQIETFGDYIGKYVRRGE